jgi:alpha-galactosidase
MQSDQPTRRDFLKTAATASLGVTSSRLLAQSHVVSGGTYLTRPPDQVSARFGMRDIQPLAHSGDAWTLPDIKVWAEPVPEGLPVRVHSKSSTLTFLHLRWTMKQAASLRMIGDHWERSYGDLEWRSIIPNRIMPWYFFSHDNAGFQAYGVKTRPSTFCFWQADEDGVTLTIDLRNGGEATLLNGRELPACTVLMWKAPGGSTIPAAAHQFCARMCDKPRLPNGPIFGSNDWNYAYGRNTADGILRDADLIASIAPPGDTRPLVVIDDGYQDAARFPDMAKLASDIRARRLRPGLWIRPLQATKAAQSSWLLPAARIGRTPSEIFPAFDPTIPEALDQVLSTVRNATGWGYEFIKHDFSTVELFGRWGFAMETGVTAPGWSFHDRSRTNAEIVGDLYRAIRASAGEQTAILGCNTMGHLAAGIFESQRIGDDTSGRDWERTRRYGVNTLTHRIAQHRTFFHADPGCVAITRAIGWQQTSQWMDVVARTGTTLFFSPEPGAVTPEIKTAMAEAFAIVAAGAAGSPADPLEGTTPGEWLFKQPKSLTKNYEWVGKMGTTPFPV